MKYVCPLIVVKDIQRSRYLYERILGLEVKYDYGENITFRGNFSIHQEDHFRELIGGRPIVKQANNFELFFEDDHPGKIAEEIKNHGLEFVHGVKEQPWKQKVFRFYDYDGNMIEIGESLEHVAYRLWKRNFPMEDICKITYLSEDAVKKSIEEYSA